MPTLPLLRLAIVLLCAGIAAAAEPVTSLKLLTLGNSFAGNALTYLEPMAKAAGKTLVVRRCNPGGCSLAQHWARIEAGEKDPADEKGQYDGKTLGQWLAGEKWDVVTIQQYSKISHDPTTYQPFADQILAYLKEHAPQAEVVLHQTWAYRRDDPRFGPGGDLPSQQAMYDGSSQAYAALASDRHLRVLPSGNAFWAADSDPLWGFKPDAAFDAKTAVKPALPDQTHSLHVGYSWKDDKLAYDGHHAGKAGCYLAGLVWFESLFRQSCLEVTFVPEGLDPQYAAFLRKTAHEAVAKGLAPAAAAAP
jgi:hypothetical protein